MRPRIGTIRPMAAAHPASTKSDNPSAPLEGEILVEAAQLRPGVHVRLPVGWMEHPFMFNSFVITDMAQVRQIAALQLPQMFCDLRRCTAPPLRKPEVPREPTADELRERRESAELLARQMQDKQARANAVKALRARLDVAQTHYLGAAKAVGSALKRFDIDPQESARQVMLVSSESTAVLMRDSDSAVALIAEKGHSDMLYAHALSVMTLALLLGKHAGLPEAALKEVGIGALLHDVGKLGLNASVMRKAERSRHEEVIYQAHCRHGLDEAQRAGCLSRAVLDTIAHHHERADGSGFPAGLGAQRIPLAARIVAIANRFDNLTNPLDPRRALTPSEALATMWVKEQSAFDPMLLQLFVRAMGVYPPGSLVQLSDGRDGVVVASAAGNAPLRPQVLVYEPRIPRRHAIIVDLTQDASLDVVRARPVQDLPADELDYLLPRRKLSWFHMSNS